MFDNLSFSQKMKFSIILFSIPLLTLGFLVYRSHQSQITSTELEIQGTEFQRPLMRLLIQILEFRRLQNLSTSSNEKLESQLKLLKTSFDQLKVEFHTKQSDLGFDSSTLQKYGRTQLSEANLTSAWKHLNDSPRDRRASEILVALIQDFIRHSSDTSALILDPDLDSYYLMDAISTTTPQFAARLFEVLESVESQVRPTELPIKKRISLIQNIGFLVDSDFPQLKSKLEFSLKSDADFYGLSPSLQDRIKNVSQSFDSFKTPFSHLQQSLLQDIGIDEKNRNDLQKIPQELLSGWEVMSEELGKLLDTRTQSLRSSRNLDLSLAIVIWIASCLFALSFSNKLSKIVAFVAERLQTLGQQVTSESAQIKSNSQMLSSTSIESASALEESVATIEELNSMLAQTARSCSSVDELSKRAVESASGGQSIFNELVQHMNSIESESSRIEEIVSVIEDITFQINLLALNAAVEAARAGEQGRGFSIVAENVRVLAQKSSTASKGIGELIKSNVSSIKRSTLLVDNCRISLDSISKDIRHVAEMNHEVAVSTQEQSSGLKQLSIALNGIDQKTQSNASASEFLAQSSLQLDDESRHMKEHIETLSGLVKGR